MRDFLIVMRDVAVYVLLVAAVIAAVGYGMVFIIESVL